jgi:hypothetical protein
VFYAGKKGKSKKKGDSEGAGCKHPFVEVRRYFHFNQV